MPTKPKPAAHVAISYAICMSAATLAIVGVQYVSHNAVNQTLAGLLIPVLAQGLAYALRATGQVDVPDAPASVDVAALAAELGPLVAPVVEASAGKGAGAAVVAALAPAAHAEAGPAPDANPAPAATAV